MAGKPATRDILWALPQLLWVHLIGAAWAGINRPHCVFRFEDDSASPSGWQMVAATSF